MRFLAVTTLIILSPVIVQADHIITGSGTNTSNGYSWSLSFELAAVAPLVNYGNYSVSNASYLENGAAVFGTPVSASFYDSGSGGMFDLIFSSKTVSFNGAEILSLADLTNSAVTGTSTNYNDLTGVISVHTVVAGPSNVPEPSTFALLGLGAVGFVVRAVRRRNHQAA